MVLLGIVFATRVHPQSAPGLRTDVIWGDLLAPGVLSLTYDDGPTGGTVALADYLKSEGVRATFFVVPYPHWDFVDDMLQPLDPPDRLSQTLDILPQIVARGHRVANHTAQHWWFDKSDQPPVLPGDPPINPGDVPRNPSTTSSPLHKEAR